MITFDGNLKDKSAAEAMAGMYNAVQDICKEASELCDKYRPHNNEPIIVDTLEQVHEVLEHSRLGHLMNKHETAMAILEGIKSFERMMVVGRDNVELLKRVDLWNEKNKWNHKLEIYSMCIARLWQRYKKAVQNINNVNQYI
jgi:hypothetical protein